MKRRKLNKLVGSWRPWDYGFNLDIEREMFRKQAEYFKTSNIAVNDERRSEICNLLVKLLDIVIGRDRRWEIVENTIHFKPTSNGLYRMLGNVTFKDTIYINKRNAHRFLNKYTIEHLDDTWHDLREAKAWYLYNKLRFYKMKEIWN